MEEKDHPLKKLARLAGFFYLIEIIAGIFTEVFVRGKLVVSGNASATTSNILLSEGLWRVGFISDIIMLICDVFVTLILYVICKQINKNIALISAAFSLITDAIQGINSLYHFAPILILGQHSDYLKAFNTDQLQALSLLSLHLHDYGNMIGLVFFSFHCLLLGYLFYKSSHFSKILGILFIIAGFSYFTNSFSWFLSPAFADKLYPLILLPCLIAELFLSLWLLFKRVKFQK